MLDKLTQDDFERCLEEKFLIRVEGREPLETELVEVKGLVAPDDDPDRRRPFSLIFEGPPDVALQQGIHRLENETLGALDVFVVTLGPHREKMRHEVVFA